VIKAIRINSREPSDLWLAPAQKITGVTSQLNPASKRDRRLLQ